MDYNNILQLKEQGFNNMQIARKVGLARNTVKKYLKMDPTELEEWLLTLETRKKKLDPYRDRILNWLREHPDLSSAQVLDWLEERINVVDVTEGTVRNFVKELREVHHIPKTATYRIYEAVEELPPGVQGQVDFGEIVLLMEDGRKQKVYCIGFVLSHSRYKYVEWLDRPFRTEDVIRTHENAFRFYGGLPEEMVYDQDKLMIVTENAGDILFTERFQRYRAFRDFRIYLCRKGDPESKGKIENVIKFVKYNFSKNRTYVNLETLNEQTIKWLKRTGNHKVHQTIKKRPSEVFALEKQHLKRLTSSFSLENDSGSSVTRNVQKDNVIRYGGNRYSVPAGTYNPKTSNIVHLETNDPKRLRIRLEPNGKVIADHPLSKEKGVLVKDPAHQRKANTKTESLSNEVRILFSEKELIEWYIGELKLKYPRHLIDQLMVMRNAVRHNPELADDALRQAKMYNLISANDFRDILFSLHKESSNPKAESTGASPQYSHLKASERSMDYYVDVMKGGLS